MVKQITNDFGIEFVSEADVPEAARQNDRNPALWKAVIMLLKKNAGTWAKVREFDKPVNAGAKASSINGNRNKAFPADQWEARHTKSDTGSVLYMRFVGTAEQAAESAPKIEGNDSV